VSPSSADDAGWSAPGRIAFRLLFVYLFLYNFPFPAGLVPGTQWLADLVDRGLQVAVAWTGTYVLGLAQPPLEHPTGSGDTLFSYVALVVFVLIAVAVTLVWSILDRRTTHHRRLHEWLRVYVRFCLATTMLSYGLVKVWKSQFIFPLEVRLLQPYGASTPMALLWNFMGASTPYTMFGGFAESLSGVLLFFRRTTLVGALAAAGVMTNVAALNLCYDVPVKQYSMHLVAMAIFLAAPDLPRLLRYLTPAAPTPPGRRVLGLLVAVLLVYEVGKGAIEGYREYGEGSPPPDEYVVESMTPPLWKHITIATIGMAALTATDAVDRVRWRRDDSAGTVSLSEVFAPDATYVLRLHQPDPEHIVLAGRFRKDDITVILRRAAPRDHRLKHQEFRWIQEYPDNR